MPHHRRRSRRNRRTATPLCLPAAPTTAKQRLYVSTALDALYRDPRTSEYSIDVVTAWAPPIDVVQACGTVPLGTAHVDPTTNTLHVQIYRQPIGSFAADHDLVDTIAEVIDSLLDDTLGS